MLFIFIQLFQVSQLYEKGFLKFIFRYTNIEPI
jgi:hypothetical protein